MRFNVLALEALRGFVEGGSLAKAAQAVHRTEPQASRLLTSLQDEVGFPILRKEGRILVLTAEGHGFYERVERFLSMGDDLQDFSREIRRLRLNHVKVIAAPHFADGLLVEALIGVKARNPDFTANIDVRSTRDIDALVGYTQFDLALTQLPVDHPRIEVREIVQTETVVVMAADHPLRDRGEITAKDLDQQDFIQLHPSSVMQQGFDAARQGTSREDRPRFEASTGPLGAQLAARGLGIALSDPFSALSHMHHGAVLRRFTPAITLRYGAIWPSSRTASPATESLIAELVRVSGERLALVQELLSAKPGASRRS